MTLQNGILVVQAVNGATTGTGTFGLAGRAAAGAYEYMLFRGGVTPDPTTDNNWYLRNFIPSSICPVAGVSVNCGAAVPPPSPGQPAPPPTEPVAPPSGGGGAPPPGGGGASPPGDGVILHRPEVPLDSVVPALARMGVTTMLGTFHEREGEQLYASADGVLRKGWARTFGGFFERSWYGSVLPSTNGGAFGFQTGMPVIGWDHDNGHKDRIGLFFGYSKVLADVSGYALGRLNLAAGHVSIDTPSVGAYWTHFNAAGGYIDGVLMGSFINQATRSDYGISQNGSGSMVTASIEVGQPLPITTAWAIEPQAQFIVQQQQFDRTFDGFSNITFGSDTAYTGRLGARLVGDMFYNATRVRPYLLGNVWHEFKGTDIVSFADTPVFNNRGATSLELGFGGSAAISQNVDLFGKISHTLSIDDGDQRFTAGKLGVQVRF